jgi:1,4-dihydroxy-2-naphthoate octaprenyltransferase
MLAWLAIPMALVLGRAIASTSGRALNPLLAGTARLTLLFSLLFASGLVL